MLGILEHLIEHTFLDSVKLLPFLFLTYLVMEYLEHKASAKTMEWVQHSGKLGPFAGGILGIVPQCGFSAAASNLYAGRIITLGTLFAVYLSTSDEMLPVMISEKASLELILKILLPKAAIGIIAGFITDFVVNSSTRPPKKEQPPIHEICEQEHCHCEKGIVRSAVWHTLQIFAFILLIGALLELILQFVGEETLGNVIRNRAITGPMLAGLVGLIPNCAASVAITELYLKNALDYGAMLSGLLVNAGVGLVVLFRVNPDKKENLKILGLLYFIGIFVGIVVSFFQ